jgi:hypothetical protein
MPFVKILIHAVWATKDRKNLFRKNAMNFFGIIILMNEKG